MLRDQRCWRANLQMSTNQPSNSSSRPPVIAVLGHVDHGKTSVLDRLRNANVAAGEAGGITQAIGAYQITHQGKLITFIDTPGHAAFSAMRARGGQAADIAILVVAADDGVMPQTKESIEHIQKAGIPFVVAINKVDLPDANILKVKQGLADCNIYVEGYGGNVPVVEISAKTGAGFDTLLETILLLSEIEDLKDTKQLPTVALVIESSLHPQKGPLATLLVQEGILKNKDDLFLGQNKIGKIKSLLTAAGSSVETAAPSTPVQVLGFTSVPPVGENITITPNTLIQKDNSKIQRAAIQADEADRPQIILKADVAGSLEALLGSLPDTVTVINSGVGAVTESDVQLALTNHAMIICFNLKTPTNVARLASVEGVEIVNFKIIYELFDYLKEISKILKEKNNPIPTGEALIKKLFPFNDQTVYGCLITSGKIRINDNVKGSKVISIRVGKESVKEAKKDTECGIILDPAQDLKEGDILSAI